MPLHYYRLVLPLNADGFLEDISDRADLLFALGHEAGHLYLWLFEGALYLDPTEKEQVCDALAVLNLLRDVRVATGLRDRVSEWGEIAKKWGDGPMRRHRAQLIEDMLHAALSPLPFTRTGVPYETRRGAMRAALAGNIPAIALRSRGSRLDEHLKKAIVRLFGTAGGPIAVKSHRCSLGSIREEHPRPSW